jgi:hypothetical protein
MTWCVFAGAMPLNVAAADDAKSTEPPIQLAVTVRTKPSEPAGNIGSNMVAVGLISASVNVSVDRVRRIQIVQRIEPEILQIVPSLRPAGLD